MKYLENSIKFISRFYILIVPLYVLYALPALIQGAGAVSVFGSFWRLASAVKNPLSQMQNPMELMGLFSGVFAAAAGAGFIGFILKFLAIPATYGMVHKAIRTNHADLNDYLTSLKENIVKYILYWVLNLVVWLIVGIAAVILIMVAAVFIRLSVGLGILLMILFGLAIIVAAIIIGVLLSLWFAAMVVDHLDVLAAMKKSVKTAQGNFWTLLGIIILVGLAGMIASAILSFLSFIPLIGALILSLIPAITGFIMTFFYISIYKDKTDINVKPV